MDYGLAPMLIVGALYMAPTLLAMLVRHRNRWTIAVLNALLGWTIIGYLPVLYLLVWPLTSHGQLSRQLDDLNDKLKELRAAEHPSGADRLSGWPAATRRQPGSPTAGAGPTCVARHMRPRCQRRFS